VEDAATAEPLVVLEETALVEIVSPGSARATEGHGWLNVEIRNLDGNSVGLRVMPHATVLQMKHAVAQAEGSPCFQQSLWLEGAEEEMQNKLTAAESGVIDESNVFLIKGDAASWQVALLNEPELFDVLADFMALSVWREKGGYEKAGKAMEAKVGEWEDPSSGLSKHELLRRKVIVGKFYVECGGQYERAIELLEAVAEEVQGLDEQGARDDEKAAAEEQEKQEQEQEEQTTCEPSAPVLPLVEGPSCRALVAQMHMALGGAFAARECGKPLVRDTIWLNQKRALDEFQKAACMWRKLAEDNEGAGSSKASSSKAGSSKDGVKSHRAEPREDFDRVAFAESLRGVGDNASRCTSRGRQGYPLSEEQAGAMNKLAEEANMEALKIFAELEHPHLGAMYKVVGSHFRVKYNNSDDADAALGELGDQAIEYYQLGADTFVRMGLNGTDKEYGSCLSNLGIVHEDRREWEQAMVCYVRAAIADEKILGKEHPTTGKDRGWAAEALEKLGRRDEAAAVTAGNELIEETVNGEETGLVPNAMVVRL
jgi:tetratricopeptide (TPR) repeat protein